jgi:GNAT superfamily N-acetyltransferase
MIVIQVHDAADESIVPVLDEHCRRARKEATQFRGRVSLSTTDVPRRAYVAVVGTSAVGSLVVRVGIAGEWTVERVHVIHEARGIGVGNALMRKMLADALDEGCTRVASVALPGDRATKNLFERFGLIAEAIVVSKELRP